MGIQSTHSTHNIPAVGYLLPVMNSPNNTPGVFTLSVPLSPIEGENETEESRYRNIVILESPTAPLNQAIYSPGDSSLIENETFISSGISSGQNGKIISGRSILDLFPPKDEVFLGEKELYETIKERISEYEELFPEKKLLLNYLNNTLSYERSFLPYEWIELRSMHKKFTSRKVHALIVGNSRKRPSPSSNASSAKRVKLSD